MSSNLLSDIHIFDSIPIINNKTIVTRNYSLKIIIFTKADCDFIPARARRSFFLSFFFTNCFSQISSKFEDAFTRNVRSFFERE